MASNENKDPIGNLTDKLRSLFGSGDLPKNNNALPPKTRFNIWYVLLAVLFFSYLQPLSCLYPARVSLNFINNISKKSEH